MPWGDGTPKEPGLARVVGGSGKPYRPWGLLAHGGRAAVEALGPLADGGGVIRETGGLSTE